MPATFEPRLDILPESQRRLWPELDAVPSDFVLYGGTALALQLGHRVSEDFDFFSSAGFDPDRLRSRLPFFRELDPADPDAWVQRKRDTLEAFVDRGGPVKLAFFGGLDTLGRIEDPRRASWIPGAGRLPGGPGRDENAGDPGPGKLEGLRRSPHAGCARGGCSNRPGRGESESTGILIRGSAFGPYSFMGTGRWIGCPWGCSGI